MVKNVAKTNKSFISVLALAAALVCLLAAGLYPAMKAHAAEPAKQTASASVAAEKTAGAQQDVPAEAGGFTAVFIAVVVSLIVLLVVSAVTISIVVGITRGMGESDSNV